jgi:hypothetical protein
VTQVPTNAMLPEKNCSLHRCIGRYLYRWAVTQADVWFLIYRCVDLVTKVHGPLDRSARILEQLLRVDDEDQADTEDDRVENNENGALDCVFRTSYRWRQVRRPG